MKRAAAFIGEAWIFASKQPALLRSGFFLVFLPMLAGEILPLPESDARPEIIAVAVVAQLALAVLVLWGSACTLTVGRRLLQAKAGRTRTSFMAVQEQARGLVIPLLLTEILRSCIAFFWALPGIAAAILLILGDRSAFDAGDITTVLIGRPWIIGVVCLLLLLPAIYLLLTSLTPMVVAYEKISFRAALKRSRLLVKGHIGELLVVQGFLWLCLIVPAYLAYGLLTLLPPFPGSFVVAALPFCALGAAGSVLWILCLTLYYKELGGKVK